MGRQISPKLVKLYSQLEQVESKITFLQTKERLQMESFNRTQSWATLQNYNKTKDLIKKSQEEYDKIEAEINRLHDLDL